MSVGIAYALRRTNVDAETGIRFGVISQYAVWHDWVDTAEVDYGKPYCPRCGQEVGAIASFSCDDKLQFDDWERPNRSDWEEFVCTNCKIVFGGSAYPKEPIRWYVNDVDYKLTDFLDSKILVIRSPFYTRAVSCSPHVPDACSIESPDENGERAYCLGLAWFNPDLEPCPYPIYRVDNDKLVYEQKG